MQLHRTTEKLFQLLQDVVTHIRGLRADHKIDKKVKLNGALAVEGSAPIAMIEQLANVELAVASASGPGFDLKLELPEAAGPSEEQKERLRKENEQLEKVIANSSRQLANEAFVAKAPAHVIAGMRAKLAEYEAQLAKNKAALGG